MLCRICKKILGEELEENRTVYKKYLECIKQKLAECLSFEKRFDTHILIPKTELEDGDLEYVYRFLYSTFSAMNLEDVLKILKMRLKGIKIEEVG